MKSTIFTALVALLAVATVITVGLTVVPRLMHGTPPTPTPTMQLPITAIPTYFSASTIDTPTAIVYPTYIYQPTVTPIASATPWNFTPPVGSIPGGASSSSNPQCAYQLNNAAAVHDTRLNIIEKRYAPRIAYYQQLINEAAGDRDALRLAELQDDLKNVQSQYQAEVRAENKRYRNEVANIQATYCQ